MNKGTEILFVPQTIRHQSLLFRFDTVKFRHRSDFTHIQYLPSKRRSFLFSNLFILVFYVNTRLICLSRLPHDD